MNCPDCGHEVGASATFCPHCGIRLEGATSGTTAAATAKPSTSPGSPAQPNSPSASAVGDSSPGSSPTDRLLGGSRRGKHPPEEELWSGGFSPKAMLGPLVAVSTLTIILLVAVIMFWNSGWGWTSLGIAVVLLYAGVGLTYGYRRLSEHYRLTTYRFFHEKGLLSRVTERVEVIDIDDVTVKQGVVERMLGVGTILIHSSDKTHPALRLPGIDEVRRVGDLIDNTRRAERQRRGIHIESI